MERVGKFMGDLMEELSKKYSRRIRACTSNLLPVSREIFGEAFERINRRNPAIISVRTSERGFGKASYSILIRIVEELSVEHLEKL